MNDDKEYFARFPKYSLTVLPWFIWLVIILSVVFVTRAYAAPIAVAEEKGVRIVLTDDPCTLKEVVNLGRKVTWTEKGKTYEGCYEVHPYGIVVAYFNDKKVAVFPVDVFQKASGA